VAFKVVNNVVVTDTEDGQLENLSIDGTSVLVGDGAGNVTLQNVTISSSVGIGSLNINDLGDVDTVSTLPVNGDALVWNSTSSVWEPQAPFSQADFDTAFALKTTTNLTEGSNLYYTTTRANTDFDTRLATKTTANLTEGSNLYFTDERVDDRVANLLVAGTNIVLSYDDSAGTLTVNASSTGGYDLSSNTTTDLTEGTNLYYTTARANTDIDARVTTSFVNALNVTAASVQADSVTLGTDTTGNYVATITGTTNEVEVTGSGTETAAVTIGLPNDVTISNDLTVSGNLTVNGTTVTVNVATLEVEDKDIVVAKNATTSGEADGAGLIIGSSVATMLYQSSGDKFVMSKSLDTDLIGNADTATALATARAIQVSGAVTGTANFDGTAGINIVTTATSDPTLTLAGDLSGSATFTNLGNATLTATLTKDPTITLTGDVTGSGTMTNLGDVSFATTIAANSVALGTDTTGNYVGTITGGTGIASSGGTSGEGVAHTLSVDLSELTDMTAAMVGTDEFIVLDAGADRRKAANEIGLSIFNNDAGFTTNVGDITGVTAGTGLSGGGSSGSVTLTVDLSELTDMTATMVGTDEFIVLDAGADRRKAASEIGLSIFSNDAGFTTNTGDITNVSVSGTGLSGGGASGSVTITSNATSANTGSTIVARDGSGNFSAGVITATATQARYADLAEMYAADGDIEAGTVVHFAGEGKLAACDQANHHAVAGIISTDPAYLMNTDQQGVALAISGRVPCKVTGVVNAGDLMVSAGNGRAMANNSPAIGTVIGKAIEANAGGEAVIEVLAMMM